MLAVIRADKDIRSGNTKKVYDLVETEILPHFNFTRMTRLAIAGVSLVQNYRSTFASEIQKSGIDGLIATLANKNKTLQQQSAGK